ncbi:unnamed protein product, partial [Amoebophrya sp. A25]
QKHDYKLLWLEFEVSIEDREYWQLYKVDDSEKELLFRFASKMRTILGFHDSLYDINAPGDADRMYPVKKNMFSKLHDLENLS